MGTIRRFSYLFLLKGKDGDEFKDAEEGGGEDDGWAPDEDDLELPADLEPAPVPTGIE